MGEELRPLLFPSTPRSMRSGHMVPIELLSPLIEVTSPWVAEHKQSDKCDNQIFIAGILCAIAFGTQFLMFAANEKADGLYTFNIGNFFFSSSLATSISIFIEAKVYAKHRLLASRPCNRNLFKLFMARFMNSLGDVIQTIGLKLTTPPVAAALWFSKILMTAICLGLLGGKWPSRPLILLNISIFLQICLYIYTNESSQDVPLQGMLLLILAMFFYAISDVGTNLTIASCIQMTDKEVTFWSYLLACPSYFLAIFPCGLLDPKPIVFTDFIPFYGYTWLAWLLIFFFIYLMNAPSIALIAYDVRTYVSVAYTGTYIQIILAHILVGFRDFTMSRFLMDSIIFVTTISYALINVKDEKAMIDANITNEVKELIVTEDFAGLRDVIERTRRFSLTKLKKLKSEIDSESDTRSEQTFPDLAI